MLRSRQFPAGIHGLQIERGIGSEDDPVARYRSKSWHISASSTLPEPVA
jgi:hypothetical protein